LEKTSKKLFGGNAQGSTVHLTSMGREKGERKKILRKKKTLPDKQFEK